ncbi:MAG: FHA domain-containing protein, partial [Thermoanaerobaculia bacterium]
QEQPLGARDAGFAPDEDNALGIGWVRVRGQQIWLSPDTREVQNGRAKGLLDREKLRAGQEVGVYAKYYGGLRGNLAIGHYLTPNPGKPASGAALEPLAEQSSRNNTTSFLIFSIVAGLIGLAIGAADGIVCRLPRRAMLGGLVGLLVGFVGGLLSGAIANVIYIPLSHLAQQQMSSSSEGAHAFGFLLQMVARMFAWTLAGMAMGLGQGIALRSKRLLGYGFLGGLIGGLLGGLLFDPLDLVIIGPSSIGAGWSRMVGFIIIGAAVGAMIGLVELLSRDAWLRMTEGPLAGKEFLIFRDVMNIGASPRSEIYLFNDPRVAPTHASLRTLGDEIEISATDRVHPLLVNNNAIRTARLRHGDRITIGATSFVFEQRQR